jgi:MoxR-like ATPase
MSENGAVGTGGSAIADAHKIATSLREQISRVMVGQQQVVEQVLIALFAAGHVLVEGVPGLGKTLLVRALAKTFDGSFARIQFTPDLMPSDITGHAMYDMKTESFKIRRGPVFANLLLADEINRAPAKTQAALLEVMQEQQITIEGKALPMVTPFMTLATQNPIEQEGTYPLPEAQLDRFLLKVLIEYPSREEENQLVGMVTGQQIGDTINVDAVQTIVSADDIKNIQRITASLQVDDRVVDYAVRITQKTRNWPGITVGAGPRGGIALIRAARAAALLNGHDYVTPDDVKDIAAAALRHRIILSPEMEIEGQTPDSMLAAILENTEAPRT